MIEQETSSIRLKNCKRENNRGQQLKFHTQIKNKVKINLSSKATKDHNKIAQRSTGEVAEQEKS